MQLYRFYLSVAFCIVSALVYGQQQPLLWSFADIQKQYKQPIIKHSSATSFGRKDTMIIAAICKPSLPLPLNFYTQHMGAVCKIELQIQKQLKFPLYVRVGSKDYVDQLEGKLRRR